MVWTGSRILAVHLSCLSLVGCISQVSAPNLDLTSSGKSGVVSAQSTPVASPTVNIQPILSSVSPISGTNLGGTTLTLSGTGLPTSPTVGLYIMPNGNAATAVTETCTVISATSTTILCTTSAAPLKISGDRAYGLSSVVVTDSSSGLSSWLFNSFNYTATPPTLSTVSPVTGSISGGYTATLTGTGFFLSGITVTIGGVACTSVTSTGTSITCTVGSGVAGLASVVVTNPDSNTATLSGAFTYFGSPNISVVANRLFPLTNTSGPLPQGSPLSLSILTQDVASANPQLTGCSFMPIGLHTSDPNYPVPSPCPSFPCPCASLTSLDANGALSYASFGPTPTPTNSGTFSWTPTSTQRGTYEFTFTVTTTHTGAPIPTPTYTSGFIVSVRDPDSTTNLLASVDALFSAPGSVSALSSISAIPRITANSNNNVTQSWIDLISTSSWRLATFLTSNPWVGTGEVSPTPSPYALSLSGSSSGSYNDSFSMNYLSSTGQVPASQAVSLWIKPSPSPSAGTVIIGNGGGYSNGLAVRHGVNDPNRLEFVIGSNRVGINSLNSTYSYKSLILSDSPFEYWRLGESSGTVAAGSAARGIPGTYSATGITYSAAGVVGDDTAVSFSGTSSYVQIPHTAIASPCPTFTALSVELWVKPTSLNTSAALLSKEGLDATYGYGLHQNSDNSLSFVVGNKTAGSGGTGTKITSTTHLQSISTWYHVVGTYDGVNTAQIYVNGALSGSSTSVGAHSMGSTVDLYLGQNPDGTSPYSGNLDEVVLYSRALSAQDVLNHYNTATGRATKLYPANAVLSDNPVAYYKFNELSGRVVQDYSGNNNPMQYSATGVTLMQPAPSPSPSSTASAGYPFFVARNPDDYSVAFDGSTGQAATSSHVSALNPSWFSVEAWAHLNAASDAQQTIVNSRNLVGGSYLGYLLYYSNSGNKKWGIWVSGSNPFSTNIADTYWNHLVGTYDGTILRLYVNGTLQSSAPVSGFTPSSSALFSVGVDYDGTNLFSGNIAEVAVYNYPLTATQVSNHFNYGTSWICQTRSQISTSNWSFLTALFDGTTAKLYINGQRECSVAPGMQNQSFGTLTVGAPYGQTSYDTVSYWKGLLAKISIFGVDAGNTLIDASTIKSNFAAGANRFRTTPVESIVTSGLIYHLDAANAQQGVAPYATGSYAADKSDLTWYDLATQVPGFTAPSPTPSPVPSPPVVPPVPGLFGFEAGYSNGAKGWSGAGVPVDPYRLSFDGSSNYVLNSEVINTSTVTVEAWVYIRTLPDAADSLIGGFVQGNISATRDKILLLDGSNNLIFRVNNGSDQDTSASTALSDSTWYHVVGTADGSKITAYVNGAVAGSKTSVTSTLTSYSAANLMVGGKISGGNYIQQDVAVFRIYNRALSAAEIIQNCTNQQARFGVSSCASN